MSKARKKGRHTIADADAVFKQMKPISINFNWTDEEWANDHLPVVRVAAAICGKTVWELRECLEKLAGDPEAADQFLEGLAVTKRQFEAMVN